jgi:hypothetical protein
LASSLFSSLFLLILFYLILAFLAYFILFQKLIIKNNNINFLSRIFQTYARVRRYTPVAGDLAKAAILFYGPDALPDVRPAITG